MLHYVSLIALRTFVQTYCSYEVVGTPIFEGGRQGIGGLYYRQLMSYGGFLYPQFARPPAYFETL
jgi:hypothetical protein